MLKDVYPLPADDAHPGCAVDQLILRGNIRRLHGGWGALGNSDFKNRP